VYGFQNLATYRKAVDLADELRGCVRSRESLDRWSVGIQALRAADSVGANLAEGYGRGPFADRQRFLFIARGSACELEHWLRRATTRGLPCPDNAVERADEIGRMLNGLIRNAGRAGA
jgi:four helix bundle protein